MFSIWVTLTIDTEREAEFLASITIDAERSVADEPGCLGFDVIALDRGQGRWAFYERYVDEDAFRLDHQSRPHFHQWAELKERVIVPDSTELTVVETVVAAHA